MKRTLAMLAAASLAGACLAGEPLEVTAPGPEGDLAGTLIPPEEGKPTVLIVPGSGPTDRDGNNPLGVTSAAYRVLAEALAERGIGSLRIDKRGMFASAAAIPDPNDVTIAAYAEDVAAWAEVDLPMLIVAGGRDPQTPFADAEALAAGQPGAKLVVIEDMNHVLRQVAGEGSAVHLASYRDPSMPVHPELVEAVAAFVTGN